MYNRACSQHSDNVIFTRISRNTQSKSYMHHWQSTSGISKMMHCGILIKTPNLVYNKVMTPCQVNIKTCCWVSIPGIFLISFLIGVTLIPSALRSRWACFIASIHLSEFSIVPTTSLKEITDNRYINYIPLNVPKRMIKKRQDIEKIWKNCCMKLIAWLMSNMVSKLSQNRTHLCPLSIARSIQLNPSAVIMLTLAPLSISSLTQSGCPLLHAKCRGVVLLLSVGSRGES